VVRLHLCERLLCVFQPGQSDLPREEVVQRRVVLLVDALLRAQGERLREVVESSLVTEREP